MLIFFVGIVFCVINPLVPVMALVYFTVALLTERYSMLYVFVPVAAESGGKVGPLNSHALKSYMQGQNFAARASD